VITAVGTFVTAIAVLIGALANYRATHKVKDNVAQVHTIVNQQRTDMQNVIAYQKHLIDQLQAERDA
jgi:ABC-type transporter MlaC component